MSEDDERAVGSVAEEAAKLLGALQDWARESGQDTATGGAASAASWFQNVNEHIANGEDCRYCPLCQAISLVRQTSPEVKHHLSVAASSLLQAAVAAMPQPPHNERDRQADRVERIDLSDDLWEDD